MSSIVGHVAQLYRFPVKSMAGERLLVAELDWQGIEGDRQYAFLRTANGSRFPWLTAREVPAMLLHRATFVDPQAPKTSAVQVETPDGRAISVNDPLLHAHLAAAAEEPIELIQSGRGFPDAMPVSIVTTASHEAIEAAHGEPLDPRRFRTNLVIASDLPVEAWQGRRLTFGPHGGAEVQIAAAIPRCVLVTADPDTGSRDPRLIRTIVRDFDNAYGVYAAPARPGLIRVGDAVRLMD